jgi:aerobic carbon-monoxide dehydrogenase large subunit
MAIGQSALYDRLLIAGPAGFPIRSDLMTLHQSVGAGAPLSSDDKALQPFGIGQPVSRKEDPILLRGEARYTDDLALPRQLYAAMVRSPVAHGLIQGIDAQAARAMPGVLGVYTGADLQAAGYGLLPCVLPFKNRDGSPMQVPPRPAFAIDRVRFVGDPVAFVVANTPTAARDAAEAVILDLEELPAVTDARAALEPDAPRLFETLPDNCVLDYHFGDTAKTDAAFAKAHHVAKLNLISNRLAVCPMEPRSAIGVYDKRTKRFVLHVGSQGVFGLRNMMADVMGVEKSAMRVLTGQVGGSFGMKIAPYPEYIGVLHAAKQLGRPIKWTDDRSSAFLSDQQGRDHEYEAALALDAKGRFLALRVTGFANMGAYLASVAPLPPTRNIVINAIAGYRTPLIEVAMRCAMTNTPSVGAYRGAGRPEGNYIIERLIDTAAREMGIDRVKLRRINQVKPSQMPYTPPSGVVYDSGDFGAVLDKALLAADWKSFASRRKAAAKKGLLRGIGIGCYVEATATHTAEMGGIRFEADGSVTMITGTLDYGQGHASSFAQVLVDKLGIPFERFKLLQGDSDEMLAGGGTGGSRSLMASGAALLAAGDGVIAKGRKSAAWLLEAGEADIVFEGGRFSIAGTDRGIALLDLAERLRAAPNRPAEIPESLDVSLVQEGLVPAYPNGCHIAELEVDPETGHVEIARYTMVNDFGTLVNPMLVEGQLHGGVTQGIGQAFMERIVYDEAGQPLTGSYMDYALPRADDVPFFTFHSHPVPAKTNPLGAKGCGEAGCAGSITSLMNALHDALHPLGIEHIDMPATPLRLWEMINKARHPSARA